jgi:hypothetical protein
MDPREKLTLVIVLSSSVFLEIDEKVPKSGLYRWHGFSKSSRGPAINFCDPFRQFSLQIADSNRSRTAIARALLEMESAHFRQTMADEPLGTS